VGRRQRLLSLWILRFILPFYDSVFFGHSVSQRTMMEKTKELREPRLVLKKSKKALSSSKVHIGVFDNSQKGTNLTVQRFGMSNMFCKVTTRIFIAVECEQTPTSFPANVVSEHAPLTYEQRAIPSPLGLPEFELELGKPRSFAILSQATEHYLPSMTVDFTGSRVAKYMELLEMAKELRHQKHYLSCPDKCYAFQPILLQTANLNTVRAVLSRNRPRDGIYALGESFQYNTVVKWRGERKRAQILCPPVSANDKTTKKGAGNVTLSMLELCGILNVDIASTDISLGDDIFNRWLILVGDGLSHVRVANFKDCMEDRLRNF
jgi:hypothetical protein